MSRPQKRLMDARELLATVIEEPSFSDITGEGFTLEMATEQYQRWASSWVTPKVKRLVPELREKKVKP